MPLNNIIRLILMVLAIQLCALHVSAVEKPQMHWSGPVEFDKDLPSLFIPKGINNSNYLIRYNARSPRDPVAIQHWDQNLNLISEKKLLNSPFERISSFFSLENSLVLLYHYFDRSKDSYFLKAELLDEQLNNLSSGVQLTHHHFKPADGYAPAISRDTDPVSGKTAVVYPDSDNAFQIFTLNERLNKTDSLTVQPDTDTELDIARVRLSYPWFLVQFEASEADKPLYFAFGRFDKPDAVEFTSIENDSLIASSGQIKYNPLKNRFQFGGLAYNKNKNGLTGFVVVHWPLLEGDHEVNFSGLKDEDFYLRRAPGAGNEELTHFNVESLYLRSDGGTLMVLEKRTSDFRTRFSHSVHGAPVQSRREFFNYQDIIIASINNEGKLSWHEVIKKDQRTEQPEAVYQSFGYAITPEALFVFYNDLSGRRPDMFLHQVDRRGHRESMIVDGDFTSDRIAVPRHSRQTDKSTVLLPVYEGNKQYYLVRMHLN